MADTKQHTSGEPSNVYGKDANNSTSIFIRLKKIKTIIIAGVGFFADAYDLFIINIVMIVLGKMFKITHFDKSMVSTAALIGTMIGQLTFGFVADWVGRKIAFITTVTIIVVGAIASSLSPPLPAQSHRVIIALSLFRLFLGLGIGGEYPLAASITAESSYEPKGRGRKIATVFSMQGIGSLVATLIGMIILRASSHLELDWRLCLGLGAVPGIVSIYPRMQLHESKRFKESGISKPPLMHSLRKYWRRLVGSAGGWFLLDVTFYANGLFSATLLSLFGVGKNEPNIHQELIAIATFNVYLALIALPGYYIALFLIEHPFFGRRRLQLIGFASLGITYFIIAGLYNKLKSAPVAFLMLYGLSFFLTNAGANTTTYVLPAELYPTKVRATFHGISAAAGKLGAIIGTYSVSYLQAHPRNVFFVCGGIAILGIIVTFFFVEETLNRPMEEDEEINHNHHPLEEKNDSNANKTKEQTTPNV